jgi:plastocyanin
VNTQRRFFILSALVLSLALAACGGGGETPPEGQDVTVQGLDTFRFEPAALTASVGETVNVTLDNEGVLEHNFVLTEFNVALGPIPGGQTASGSFTPTAAGTYEYFCDVPGHREAGMVGTLTVNP